MHEPCTSFPRARRLARLLRWPALVLATWAALANWPGQSILPAISPLVAVSSIAALRAIGILVLFAVPALVLMLLIQRGFCCYVCPVGVLEETLGRLRPRAAPWSLRFPRLGAWAAAITLAGACVGYPIFLWLDPLAIFNAFFSAWRMPTGWAAILSGLALPFILAISLLVPNLWCRRLCPLGAVQDLLWLRRRFLRRAGQQRDGTGDDAPARRAFLAIGLGIAGALAIKTARRNVAAPLRPPGAVTDLSFAGLCTRCGNCVRSCPAKIIRPDLGAGGVAGFLAPVLHFDDDYCREDCHECGQVCPSGAIARLSLSEKRQRRIGQVAVTRDACLRYQRRECRICQDRCPCQAVSMETSADGFDEYPAVDPRSCTGCGACEAFCPAQPKAIHVIPTARHIV